MRPRDVAVLRSSTGYRRLRALIEREGRQGNHGRGCRSYREERLAMRMRPLMRLKA